MCIIDGVTVYPMFTNHIKAFSDTKLVVNVYFGLKNLARYYILHISNSTNVFLDSYHPLIYLSGLDSAIKFHINQLTNGCSPNIRLADMIFPAVCLSCHF